MSTKDRIKELCKNNGISANKLEKNLGFTAGYISKLDKSTPNAKNIKMIADYFNVSLDYLMTGKESRFTVEMADLDAELIFMPLRIKECALKMSKLTEEEQGQIIALVDMLCKNNAGKNKKI